MESLQKLVDDSGDDQPPEPEADVMAQCDSYDTAWTFRVKCLVTWVCKNCTG